MAKKSKASSCCDPAGMTGTCCKVESVVSVDERGQVVLPKEVRDKARIKSGDKLAVVSCGSGSMIGCLCLVRAEDFQGMLKGLLGPMLKDLVA